MPNQLKIVGRVLPAIIPIIPARKLAKTRKSALKVPLLQFHDMLSKH